MNQLSRKIQPTLKQAEAKALLNKNTILVYGGGIRSGKSFFLLLNILSFCFEYPKSRWLVIRKDMPTIRRNLFPTFQHLLTMGFDSYVKKWNQSTYVLTFTNGSQIIFMAESFADDKELNRFRGLEINGAGIDEINEIQQATFYKIIERSGSWMQGGKVPIKIIGTCNPSHGWVKELFYDRYRNNTLPDGWAYLNALITDNPFITKEYLASLEKNMPQYEYEIFVKGNWDLKLEGILFSKSDLKRFKFSDIPEKTENGNKIDPFESVTGYIDVADQGIDSLSFPIGKTIGNKIYITDVYFSKDNSDITRQICADMIIKNKINHTRIESNAMGGIFGRDVKKIVSDEYNIRLISNNQNKHTRIVMQYSFIKEYCYFLDESEYSRGSDYDLFIREILSYMKDATSKHDDAPDSLSGLVLYIRQLLSHIYN
jgi:PBSX family phage terminase large subunit